MPNVNEDLPLINSDKVEELVSLYKFPLIFGVIGLVLLASGISVVIKAQSAKPDVVFTSGEASPSAGKKIVVDVQGEVMTPGTYEFRENERISDALERVGGLSAKADREWVARNLNRAARLVDGGKIFIPSAVTNSEGKISNFQFPISNQPQNPNDKNQNILGVTAGKVNINSASQSELEGLPGVGPVTAGKIISGRPYSALEELKSKKAVGNALFEKIKDLIVLW